MEHATINRELAILKRAFSLAIKDGTLASRPYIPMLEEHNVRQGFFEREQFESVCRHLPAPWRPVMTFAYLTGWRVRSEILPLTWGHVDTTARVVRLEVGTTKNQEGRVFPYGELAELRDVLAAQAGVRDAFRTRGILCLWLFPDTHGGRLPASYRGL